MSNLLRTSILNLRSTLAATSQQYNELDTMLSFLRTQIGSRIGATHLAAFGSCSNGLWTKASDADLTLIVPRCNNKPKIITKLKTARDFVTKTADFSVLMSIVENARIPVLKLTLSDSPCLKELDVSINNISGIENSLLVKSWAQFDPRFIPLAFSIKHWAKQRGINDRSRGTLSTYTLLLQLVYVLQGRKVLPAFADFVHPEILGTPFEELNGYMRSTPFQIDYPFVSPNTADDESALLRAFFDVFGDEQLALGAEILDGSITCAPTASGALVMRCPLTGKDVNVLSASAWRAIHTEFTRARDMLRENPDIDVSALSS